MQRGSASPNNLMQFKVNMDHSPNNMQYKMNMDHSPNKYPSSQSTNSPYTPYNQRNFDRLQSQVNPTAQFDRPMYQQQQSQIYENQIPSNQYPQIPLNLEPQAGTQIILRPVGYETAYVPLEQQAVRNFSPQSYRPQNPQQLNPQSLVNHSHDPRPFHMYSPQGPPKEPIKTPIQNYMTLKVPEQKPQHQSKPSQMSQKSFQRDSSTQQLHLRTEPDQSVDSDNRLRPADDFKRRVEELNREITSSNEKTKQTTSQPVDDKIALHQKEGEHWKQRYMDLQNEKRRAIEDLQSRYDENLKNSLQNLNLSCNQRMKDIANENNMLQVQLTAALNESEKWRRKVHDLELQQFEWKTKVVDAEAQRDGVQKDLDRIQMIYRTLKNEYESQKAENEIRLKKIPKDSDIQRLHDTIELREREIDDIKARNSQLEMLCIEIKKIDTSNHELNHQLQMVHQQTLLQREAQDKKDREIEEERLKNRKLQDQIRLMMNQKRKEQSMKEDELLQEIDNLNQMMNQRNNENNQLQLMIDDLKGQLMKFQQKMSQMKNDYERELVEVAERKNHHEGEFRDNIEKKYQLLKKELDHMQQERAQLMGEIQQLSQQKLYLSNNQQQLTNDCDNLVMNLKQKNQEIQNLKNINEQLNEQLENQLQEINEINDNLHMENSNKKNIQQPDYLTMLVLQWAEIEALRNRVNEHFEIKDSMDGRQDGRFGR